MNTAPAGLLIDMHTHVTPLDFPAAPGPASAGRWPCMQCMSSVEATLLIGGKRFRRLDARSWDAETRKADMARDGIDMQLLSPMPELLSYWLDPDAAELLCDRVNHQIADMAAAHKSSFRGLGAVPLQDVPRAIRYLGRIRSEFSLSGIEIGSNIDGTMLGDPALEPFFEAAAALDIPIFVHALHPLATRNLAVDAMFNNYVGFHVEIGMAGASLIMSGLMERHPRLKIALSHGGGSLPGGLGRLDRGWATSDRFGRAAERPSDVARQHLFYDSNCYDPEQLCHLISQLGPERIFGGTDYPYAIAQPALSEFLGEGSRSAQHLLNLRSGAASLFLGEALTAEA